MNRRRFIRTTALGAGAAAVGCIGVMNGCERSPTVPEPGVRDGLRLPPTMGGRGDLIAAASGRVALGDSRYGTGWGYNESVPGPTIRVRRGERVDLQLRNDLSEETTIHWHGLVVPSSMDGHPRDAVAPGERFRYAYPIEQRAGLNWYHPHPHHRVGEQVALGLAGLFIIEDEEEAALGLPAGAREIPLAIRDARLDSAGELQYRRRDDGFRGDFPLVNGTAYPELDAETAVYRLRILNASNTRVFRLSLSSGDAFVLIGNDGGLLPTPTTLREIDVGPAERVDVLMDLRATSVGDRVALRCSLAGWNLLVLNIARAVEDAVAIPTRLPDVGSLEHGPIARERTFTFEGHHRINGERYALDRVNFRVPFGETELWRFRSQGGAPHPVHVHGTHFQVVARRGGRGTVFPWEAGWKDTVLVDDGETVDVRVRFDAYRGLYLLHCHRLEHEDSGMMLNFEVV